MRCGAGHFGQQPAFEGCSGAARALHRGGKAVEALADAGQHRGAVVGQFQRAHAAVEQRYAKKRLQRLDLPADGGECPATPSGRRVWARA